MNKEQFNTLQEFENNFNTAIHNGYTRNITNKGKETISGVYKEIFNESPRMNCTGCILKVLRKLGEVYYEYKKKQDSPLKEEKQEKVTPKKTTRKKDV